MDQPTNAAAGGVTTSRWWEGRYRKDRPKPASDYHWFFGRRGLFLEAMRRHGIALERKSVVELGGANSRFLLAMAKWCDAEATAVDFAPVGLEMTRQLFEANNCSVNVAYADFLSWDGGGRRYDLVTHWGLLEHFENPVPILEKCASLLNDGGTIVFTMPNMEALGSYFWRTWAPLNWQKHIFHSDATLRKAARAAGLELVDLFHFGIPMLSPGTEWEKRGMPQRVIAGADLSMRMAATVLPLFRKGRRSVASQRGFVLRSM